LFCHFLGPPVDGSILNGAGGIRTHDLELMRLARTAAPLPRCATRSGRQESNLRSPVPKTGGVADSPTASSKNPRRDSNPHLRVEGPASSPFDHGGLQSSGGRDRTCASRLTVARLARLDYTGTNGGSRIRTRGRAPHVNALATRRLQPLGHASKERKGRESNPQGRKAHPFSRRGTAPMAALPHFSEQTLCPSL
jgi:hypothetical protein